MRDSVNNSVFIELRRIFGTGFTGEISIHVQAGTIQNVQKIERFKPRDLGSRDSVDLVESTRNLTREHDPV